MFARYVVKCISCVAALLGYTYTISKINYNRAETTIGTFEDLSFYESQVIYEHQTNWCSDWDMIEVHQVRNGKAQLVRKIQF